MTRRWWLLLLAVSTAAIGFTFLARSPSRQIEVALRELATQLSARPGRAAKARETSAISQLEALTTENTRVRLASAAPLERDALLERTRAWMARRPNAVVSLENVVVNVWHDAAVADGELGLSESQAGDLHRTRYRFQARLKKIDTHWVIEDASLSEPLVDQPEARP